MDFATANNLNRSRSVGREQPQRRPGWSRTGKPRRGSAGMDRLGWVRRGSERSGNAGMARPGLAWPGHATQDRLGGAWRGGARRGWATQARHGPAGPGMARLGRAWKGVTRHKPGGAAGVQIAPDFLSVNQKTNTK